MENWLNTVRVGSFEASGMDKSAHGLHPVAKIDSYKGLVFATFDPEAPSLADYLGDMRYYLDAIFDMDGQGGRVHWRLREVHREVQLEIRGGELRG